MKKPNPKDYNKTYILCHECNTLQNTDPCRLCKEAKGVDGEIAGGAFDVNE